MDKLKNLQKSSAIQKNSVILLSDNIKIVYCFLLLSDKTFFLRAKKKRADFIVEVSPLCYFY